MITLVDSAGDAPALFRLVRLVEWAGFRYRDFVHLRLGQDPMPTRGVILAMGNNAMEGLLSVHGVLKRRGYVHQAGDLTVIPTIHPAFIQQGQSKWSAAFINDLQKACHLAAHGVPLEFPRYLLDPDPMEAYQWACDYIQAGSRLAFDIETPGKPDEEDESDTDGDAPDRTWNIERIGFSYQAHTAMSIPWSPPYLAPIRLLMEAPGEKVVWNQGFDVPRIRRMGIGVHGTIHDGMLAWHILHSDLPKSLNFVATFTCPWQPFWKNLSSAKPAFYNATDADVELRAMDKIEEELRRNRMWQVYQRDVLDLQPVLDHMTRRGMHVDMQVRKDRATKLAWKLQEARATMEAAVPVEARRIAHVYVNTPVDRAGLLERPSERTIPVCSGCGVARPGKAHFKRFKRKTNPCSDAGPRDTQIAVVEYYRLASFSPSRDQLIRYHQLLKRALPTVWDGKQQRRKVSFGEMQLKQLMLKFPDDRLYPAVLEYRSIDKLAGTYVGRPS